MLLTQLARVVLNQIQVTDKRRAATLGQLLGCNNFYHEGIFFGSSRLMTDKISSSASV